ncbi:MAG: guanylate kinase [Saprospiraceae bacterium]|nr:MAG: guanylate kinase [Saprospiraceae bacterium]
MSKLLIFAAPSGAGKTTIVHHLLNHFDSISFSVSATTRAQRPHERDGEDYYFLSAETFKQLIEEDAFVEWEEVYKNQFYGTLKREIERLWQENKDIIFDIDVKGALNIKKAYPEVSLSVFIKPPSPEALFERLRNRRTESEESLRIRMARVSEELMYEDRFDQVLVNDDLEVALLEAEKIVGDFLTSSHDDTHHQ